MGWDSRGTLLVRSPSVADPAPPRPPARSAVIGTPGSPEPTGIGMALPATADASGTGLHRS
ncbi:hypothetical protein [Streptomyces nodosus]|uniref:Uncharacterized protein n=1 Tax=Streptomyces nodosus TaxID=40318 RepID=A0A0B5DME5_9ACTN|nr:hypothetical protein [Streptomyces nodosus]AJE44384.1 hypothetical protein SNOD_33665 [Streptomyces nodosus]MBB4796022.1 hypothetical protein [Streptomyces nodosus]QEV42872.1 hypothetical protein CP978_33900 [Streptomyces nodosus]